MAYERLGVIGGMGPKATAVFFDKVIERTAANRDQEHLDMIILNHASLPDRTEVILNGQGERFLEAVRQDLELLEYAGVGHIAIPCNTSHYFYQEMQAMTRVPIINMVEETLDEICRTYGERSKIGIMATDGTIRSGVYERSCLAKGLELVKPEPKIQDQIMGIIYQVKRELAADVAKVEAIVRHFVQDHQCDCVILACTELSCIPLSEEAARYCIDAMDVLVRRSIELSGKQVRSDRE